MTDGDPVRPRFGAIIRAATGERVLVTFAAVNPTEFEARYADTDEPAILHPGDHLRFDAIAPGQSILIVRERKEP